MTASTVKELTRFLIFTALIAIVVTAARFSFFFLEPHFEWGDFAANALQIRDAKSFSEIYGNYSRWGFYHPGPAFFYLYAAGEVLFFDVLGLVRSPHAAHTLAGVLIQVSFFSSAVWIAKAWVDRAVWLPITLLLASLHYYLAGEAVYSIWSPNVVLLPFLCFLVASISLSLGHAPSLIPCVAAGCMLVHAHVAQPLFVVPIFVTAYGLFIVQLRQEGKGTVLSVAKGRLVTYHIAASAIVSVFLIPLILDIVKGNKSNIYAIWTHAQATRGDFNTVKESAMYFLTFFAYFQEEAFNRISEKSLTVLMGRWYYYLAWFCITVMTLVLWWRHKDKMSPELTRCLKRAFLFLGIVVGLTFVWGLKQDGQLYRFNAYFNYSIMFLMVMIFSAVVSAVVPLAGRRARLIGTALIAVAAVSLFNEAPGRPNKAMQVLEGVRDAIRDDPRVKESVVQLDFPPEEWPVAVSVALALERSEMVFRVADRWGIIFGKESTHSAARGEDARSELTWRVAGKTLATPVGSYSIQEWVMPPELAPK